MFGVGLRAGGGAGGVGGGGGGGRSEKESSGQEKHQKFSPPKNFSYRTSAGCRF